MKPQVVFRADASYEIGFGHVYRLLALNEFLAEDFSCRFHSRQLPVELQRVFVQRQIDHCEFHNDEEELAWLSRHPDCILVLDGYFFSESLLSEYESVCRTIVKIDDFYEAHPACGVVINHSPSATPERYRSTNAILALGPRYLMVRKAFFNERRQRDFLRKKIERVFICFGGSDPEGIVSRVVSSLSERTEIKELHIVSKNRYPTKAAIRSSYYSGLVDEELVELIGQSDLAITPPSTISLEVCAVGLPLIIIPTANNQEGIKEGLLRHRTATCVPLDRIARELPQAVGSLTPDSRRNMIRRQRRMIDAKSPSRFVRLFQRL